jgi:hypothetical protein
VPAEPHVVELVEARRIRQAGVRGPMFVQSEGHPHTPRWNVARDGAGRCVFFDRDGGRLCAIHQHAGAGALPSACRHFPRKILRDGRGTFISLSHVCPTAAALLLAHVPLQVVEAHPPLRLQEPVEGLDATDALPPLVRPGVLCDLDGYGAWEQACVSTFARADLGYQSALDLVAAATEDVRGWRPGSGALSDRVRAAFRVARADHGADPHAHARALETLVELAEGRVADDATRAYRLHADPRVEKTWREQIAPGFERFDAAMKNYLAARVFANWIAYEGRGLRSIVEWLRTCAALVRHNLVTRVLDSHAPGALVADDADFVEAVRAADLFLLHAADTQAFAGRFARREGAARR